MIINPIQQIGDFYGEYWRTLAQAQRYSAGLANYTDPGTLTSMLASARAVSRTEPAIEDAGIRAGEIRAWRCWLYRAGWLTSMATDLIWAPGEPMEGDVSGSIGVHGWKRLSECATYARGWGSGTVIGQVDLWGEVIEHEKGYRAQYGKIVSLTYPMGMGFWGDRKMGKLRKFYGVPHTAPDRTPVLTQPAPSSET